ncbi:protein kinase domain-containing protein [Streptomyces sp. enrichment culture]|uniref:serine/threonine-protein kinase n=1 Tax=Streptomyces sp. enrichment culture TaxID=1795815 RepID=UPI003F564C71
MRELGAEDPPGVPPAAGRGRVGAYRLLARLGTGGMGQVYLARSDRGRMVAVKLIRRELAAREEFRARFRQEVRAAQRVGGYWTAPVLDADTEAEVPWVATGYVAGPSLQQVVGVDHGPLPERSVRILAAGLAHALKDIHAAGIVHRDLKPSNVLVTIDGPRVIDFGIARALDAGGAGATGGAWDGTGTGRDAGAGSGAGADGLTRTGVLVGSPGFMAPEQVRGERLTPACDVFCLGSVLAYAATGALPFGDAGSGVHALMFRIAQEEPDLARVPEGLADLVRDCLRKDPGARPTLDRILERTGAEDTVADGRSRDPWLPSALVAQLGRHAVQLLETEDPAGAAAEDGADRAGLVEPPWARTARDGAQAPGAPAVRPSPEHAPVADGPGAPAHPAYGPPPVQGSPRPAPPVHAYGYPQPPVQPPAYGSPQPPAQPPVYGSPHPIAQPPAYGHPPAPALHTAPGPFEPPEPPRRNGRATAALVAVAVVVALAAGGSVYALLNGGDSEDRATPTPTGAPVTAPPPTPTPTPSDSGPTPSTPPDGEIPEPYLGTWTATIDNGTGRNTRVLTIRQGEVGDTVLSLTADGPTDNGTYHCVFEAELTARPAPDGPLAIGPSTVTTGEPASSCAPGAATEVTLLPDGTLRRVNTSTGEELTYRRG